MLPLIEAKKRAEAHSAEELAWLCRSFVAHEVPDYQVAAWLMAVRWQGMTESETLALTQALVASGEVLEWPRDLRVVDKHSTGGVGDKTSIALVPLLAAAGLTFVKMSGRGLGHTGGTIDKLEAIPGFQTDLEPDRLKRQVEEIGCALVAQSPTLVPADGLLYALRDVTSTVDSLPLIASSVMSKKLASGAASIILDVKYGSGAFMSTEGEAEELARAMIAIGRGAGRRVSALLSPMSEPLGMTVGNSLEVQEAIEVLHGGGPDDLRELTLELGSRLYAMAHGHPHIAAASQTLQSLIDSGAAADKLEQLIAAQGGDASVVGNPAALAQAPVVRTVAAEQGGWVTGVDARGVADAALLLGAGRVRKGDAIDTRTGVRLLARTGAAVERGTPLAEIYAAAEGAAAEAVRKLLSSVTVGEEQARRAPAHRAID